MPAAPGRTSHLVKRVVRYGAYSLAALALLVTAAGFIATRLLERPRMAAQIQAKLSAAVQGEVRWKQFSVRILPTPHAMLRELQVKTAAATFTTDEADVRLRLWPLFRGRAEIVSLEVVRPVLQLTIVPAATVPQEARLEPAPSNALQGYRSIMAAIVGALQEFAPDTEVSVSNGDLDVHVEDMPPLELKNLSLRARTSDHGVQLDGTAASRYWTTLKLAGAIEYSDLSSNAELDLTRIAGQAWLDWALRSAGMGAAVPTADLKLRFHGDAVKALELEVDGSAPTVTLTREAQRFVVAPVVLKGKLAADAGAVAFQVANVDLGASGLAGGVLRYVVKDGTIDGDVGFRIDLAQAAGYASQLAPAALARLESASGALQGQAKLALRGKDYRIAVSIDKSDAALRAKALPGPIRLTRAAIEVDPQALKVDGTAVSLPAGDITLSSLRYAMKGGALAAAADFDLGIAPTLELVRAALPEANRAALDIVQSSAGRVRGSAKGALAGKQWSGGIDITQSDASVQLRDLPGPIRLARAAIEADTKGVKAGRAAVSLPAGDIAVSNVRYAFKDGAAAATADFDLQLAQTLELVRAVLPKEKRGGLDIVKSAGGRAKGSANVTLAGRNWDVGAVVAKSDARVELAGLPGPMTLYDASIRATPKAISIERVTAALLDAKATASANVANFDKAPSVQGTLTEATIGPKVLDWLWQAQKLPPGLQPTAPMRIAAPQFSWSPKPALALQATARFEAGTAVAVDLGWSADALDVRRATIKDQLSDVALTLQMKGDVLSGKYAGTLDSRSIAAMLKSAAAPAGAVAGEFAFTIDRKERQRTQAEGSLKGEGLDLTWLAGKPAKIERMDITADATSLHIGEASLEWAGQHVTLRGSTKRTAKGPVIDAVLESPGVLVDALMPPAPAEAAEKPPAKAAEKPPAKAAEKTFKRLDIWPLPVTGKIAVRSKFVQYQHYKVAPLSADIVLEEERATLDVNEAFLCGFALPLTLEAAPKGLVVKAQVAAEGQKLEEAAHCLTNEKMLLTGAMNLRLDVRTQGQPPELLQNLKGTVTADVRNGMVMKFALLGNILSMQNVVAVAQKGANLGAEGFPFRQLRAKGHFDKGYFYLDEGVFHSNAIGLGANGWIGLSDYQTRLTVLVAPLALVDEAVRKLPILGYVVGGTFTSLPVGVSGDIRDPIVVPLGPRAITSELTGLLGRTLSLPGKVLTPDSK